VITKQYVSRLGADGRVTIPAELALAFGLKRNDFVMVEGGIDCIKVIPAKIVPKIQRAIEQ